MRFSEYVGKVRNEKENNIFISIFNITKEILDIGEFYRPKILIYCRTVIINVV